MNKEIVIHERFETPRHPRAGSRRHHRRAVYRADRSADPAELRRGADSIFDIVFGSLATLLAALCTRRLREKFWLAALMPVLFNGVIVGAVVHFCYSPAIALPLCMLSVAAGEAVACLVVGPLLIGVLRRVPASVLN